MTETIKLNIKSTQETIEIHISPQATVENFKEEITKKIQIEVSLQRIVFAGQVLVDHKKLEEYNVKENSLLYLIKGSSGKRSQKNKTQKNKQQQQQQQKQQQQKQQNNQTSTNTFQSQSFGGLGQKNEYNQFNFNQILTLMNDPNFFTVAQRMLQKPEFLDHLIQQNPLLRNMVQQNPEIRESFQNPDTIRKIMNPQFVRNTIGAYNQMHGENNQQNGNQNLNQTQNTKQTQTQTQNTKQPQNKEENKSNKQNQTQETKKQLNLNNVIQNVQNYSQRRVQQQTQNFLQRYSKELETMINMGFTNRDLNIKALIRFRGNLQNAINSLL
ncbi:ubiquilin [Anaeramoeba flamelloides]|uniref:Ubiquilin n=1 Tax=Anaeramoeba flamelloides TaxID=1746091 RepID=A0AAV8A6X4_9EUKA|nr:ubiquilin [Anaeramoeba flamelloides]